MREVKVRCRQLTRIHQEGNARGGLILVYIAIQSNQTSRSSPYVLQVPLLATYYKHGPLLQSQFATTDGGPIEPSMPNSQSNPTPNGKSKARSQSGLRGPVLPPIHSPGNCSTQGRK